MPLKLHPNCRTRLLETLAAVVTDLRIKNGRYPVRASARPSLPLAEKVLPDKGSVRDQLTEYIGPDFPLSELVFGLLAEELRRFPYEPSDDIRPLTAMEGYEDPGQVAQRFVESLESLPRRYTLSVRLPTALIPVLDSKSQIEISPKIRLVRATPDLLRQYPDETTVIGQHGGTGGLLAALIQRPDKWEKDGLYIQVDAEGFIGWWGYSAPHLEAIRILRAFCGLGLALRLFEIKSEIFPNASPRPTHAHRQDADGSMKFFTTFSLDEGISRAVDGLTLHTVNDTIKNQEGQAAWARRQFSATRSVFNGGSKADKILLATQWFFDGHSHGPDELLKFIQTMVVLEILLGDKATSDQTGLSVLLRNRCAYLIGDSQDNRAFVLDLFEQIYKVRSEIVHGGKHRLSVRESILFDQLRWLCRKVISKEVNLYMADDTGEAAPR